MEHKAFRIFASFILLVILSIIVIFNVFSILYNEFYGKLALKLAPIFCMMSIPLFYYFYYRITLYSLFIHLMLFFCLLGDLFLGLYDPNVAELTLFKNIYVILGGVSFLFARMLILLAVILYPASRFKLIKYDLISSIVSHILFNIPFVGLSFIFYFNTPNRTIAIFIMSYIILGFGVQTSYTFLRINTIEWESKISSIFGFIGIMLFNISDFILLITMFASLFPLYCILIADNIYWVSMFFLTISIIRSPHTLEEKGKKYTLLP